MHSFEVYSNESACRKVEVLGWNKSIRMLYQSAIIHSANYVFFESHTTASDLKQIIQKDSVMEMKQTKPDMNFLQKTLQ